MSSARVCAWFIVPPLKKALCQSVGIIGMWGILSSYAGAIQRVQIALVLSDAYDERLRLNTSFHLAVVYVNFCLLDYILL